MPELAVEVSGLSRVAHLTPEDFGKEIPRKWNAIEGIVTAITEQVTKEELTPLEGYRLIGCAVAETFDYKETHGSFLSASPMEMAAAIGNLLPNFGGSSRR